MQHVRGDSAAAEAGTAGSADTADDLDEVTIGEFARRSRLSLKALRLYDQLGLLQPARVDPGSGYRWYGAEQLERARLVAQLRQIGLSLAEIGTLLDRPAEAAAEQIAALWTAAEAEHAARRALATRLITRLEGSESAMSVTHETREVEVRDLPARQVLSLIRHVRPDEALPVSKEFMARFLKAGIRPLPGAEGAPYVAYHGEVTEDGDGPVEWCWPVGADQAGELAARHPDLTLRTESAHQEAYVYQGLATLVGPAQHALAIERLLTWVGLQHRTQAGSLRLVYHFIPENGDRGPDIDCAVPVR